MNLNGSTTCATAGLNNDWLGLTWVLLVTKFPLLTRCVQVLRCVTTCRLRCSAPTDQLEGHSSCAA